MEPEISPADADGAGAILVDVRTDEEWQTGHIPGAVHIPLADLATRAAELPDAPLVFYCRVGDRSSMAADAFRASGRDAASLAGGLEAWADDGHPIET
jgi:rhodanese-related sulfurtransferase